MSQLALGGAATSPTAPMLHTATATAAAAAAAAATASKNNQKAKFSTGHTPLKAGANRHTMFDGDATLFIQKLLSCDVSVADNYRRAFPTNKHHLKLKSIWEFGKIVKNGAYKLTGYNLKIGATRILFFL